MIQLDVAVPSEILFSHYVYETPRAKSLESHYQALIGEIFDVCRLVGRGPPERVYEMGSNNGEFLRALRGEFGGVTLGIEPAKNIATAANAAGITTLCTFLSKSTVPTILEYGPCDVLVARHCMAHLDDLRGTLEAVRDLLTNDGLAVIENAYVVDTINGTQFDQIYHEHHSYFALTPMAQLLEAAGLHLRHAMHSPIHGGTIVMFATKKPGIHTDELKRMLSAEHRLVEDLDAFAFRARTCIAGIREGLRSYAFKTIDSYGATAKGNTLMSVLGPDAAHIRYAVDSTPSKHGKFLPGTGVKVVSEEYISSVAADPSRWPPDAYLLTAWNYEREILEKQAAYRAMGGKFIVPLPYPRLVY